MGGWAGLTITWKPEVWRRTHWEKWQVHGARSWTGETLEFNVPISSSVDFKKRGERRQRQRQRKRKREGRERETEREEFSRGTSKVEAICYIPDASSQEARWLTSSLLLWRDTLTFPRGSECLSLPERIRDRERERERGSHIWGDSSPPRPFLAPTLPASLRRRSDRSGAGQLRLRSRSRK